MKNYECRKVCYLMCSVIPILPAAGRIIVRMKHCPQYGLLRGEASLNYRLWKNKTLMPGKPDCGKR